MSTLFSRIIAGEIPGRFIWSDDRCVAFLTIEPLAPGHALVVPRDEIDHWIDCDPELSAHLFFVAQTIGKAQMNAFSPVRIGVMVQGFEVPHAHIHVWPAQGPENFDLRHANRNPSAHSLDAAAEQLRMALGELGHGPQVPPSLASSATS